MTESSIFYRGRDTRSIYMASGSNFIILHGRGPFARREGGVLRPAQVMAGKGIEPIPSPFALAEERDCIAHPVKVKDGSFSAKPNPFQHLEDALYAEGDALAPLNHPKPVEVGVRKLEWESIDSTSMWAALPELWLCYRITLRADRMKVLRLEMLGNRDENFGAFTTWEKAKAAAQSDFDARIKSALTLTDTAKGVEPTSDLIAAIRKQYETVGVTPELKAAYEHYTALTASLSEVG